MIGKQLFNYKVTSLLGEGGMGDVYLGEHSSIGRKVAIKVLRQDLSENEEIRMRFKNEAKVMAKLQHPNIVGLYDYHEDETGLYLIMEYVEGVELADQIKELKEPMNIEVAKDTLRQVLKAFSYAHKNGVVHRDVKPANILIGHSKDVKVLDFGIAKIVGNEQFNLTKTGSNVGTAYYMSPEQVQGQELDKRSDIYSLGVTFYEMLAGFCPYKSLNSEYQIYDKIVREPLVSLMEVMGDQYQHVWGVIEKATAKNVTERYQNCEDFLAALDSKEIKTALNKPKAEPINPVRPTPKNVSESPKKSKMLIYVAIGVAALIVALVVIVQMNNAYKGNEELDFSDRVETETNQYPGRFPVASEKYLTSSDLMNYTLRELEVMRNEIFARHGYIFQTNKWSNYFDNQKWYSPRYTDVTRMLSQFERDNIELIQDREKELK